MNKPGNNCNGFEVPEDYFEKLPEVILTKISYASPHRVKVLKLSWFNKTKLLAVAATVVLISLICINYRNHSPAPDSSSAYVTNEYSQEKTIDYIAEHTDEHLLEEELENTLTITKTNPIASDAEENNYIFNYLIDNHIDTYVLIRTLNDSDTD